MSLRGRHAKTSVTPAVRFLVVTLGGTRFALHADRVQGLLTIEEARADSVLTVHGVVYPRIDLAARLCLDAAMDGPETRHILLAKGTQRGYLRVDEVHGLKEVETSHVRPLSRQFQGEEQQWYQGMIVFGDGVALLLNPAWLLEGGEVAGAEAPRTSQSRQGVLMRPAVAGGQP